MASLNPITELRADHAQVRDALLDLIESLKAGDAERALEILIQLDKLTGPHFRFEEESLYPALSRFFGDDYREALLRAHDRVIRTAKQLAEVLGKGGLTQEEGNKLADLVRREVLPHPVECDGLGLFAERLTAEELEQIGQNLEASRQSGVPLLEWASTLRKRAA